MSSAPTPATIEIDTRIVPDPARAQDVLERELGFGNYFADRMFTVTYTEGKGWHSAKIGPFENFSLSPAAAVFHYGQAIFEGQKAYQHPNGDVVMFRPDMNAKRINASATRMSMPSIPQELYLEALDQLLDCERRWVPKAENQSLYIRPFMIATEALQGVRPAKEYLFSIILSPVGAYYSGGFKPVKILVSEELVRAARGGTGAAKAAGNYASSLLAGQVAAQNECDQVLWLDAAQRTFIEEIGAMNVVFVIDDKLVTPPLGGTILAGVTRDTVLRLAQDKGIAVEERPLNIDETLAAIESGNCTEAFGCGTAAVICPIESFKYKNKSYKLRNSFGPVAKDMFETVTQIQYGNRPDTHNWLHTVPSR